MGVLSGPDHPIGTVGTVPRASLCLGASGPHPDNLPPVRSPQFNETDTPATRKVLGEKCQLYDLTYWRSASSSKECIASPASTILLPPTDFCIFRSLQNNLMGQRLTSKEEVKIKLVSFFESKPTRLNSMKEESESS